MNVLTFYPLKLNDKTRWVFVGAHDTYLIGEIKENTFIPCQEYQRYHISPGVSYAAQTFSGTGDRRIKIAWGQNSAPGAVFNSQMGLPVEMFLKQVGNIVRLGSLPIKEIDSLKKSTLVSTIWKGTGETQFGTTDGAIDVTLKIHEGCGAFILSCFGMEIKVNPATGTYSHGECTAPLSYTGEQKLRVIFDTLGLEVFADDGLIYSTMGMVANRLKPLAISSTEIISIEISADILFM